MRPCEGTRQESIESRVVVTDTATTDSASAAADKSCIDEAVAAEGRDDRKTNSSANHELSRGFSVARLKLCVSSQAKKKLPKENLLKLKDTV